jgi:hypothetical protein
MKYLVFVAYYIYALTLIGGFMWAIIYKDMSAWWVILLLLLLNITPMVKTKN